MAGFGAAIEAFITSIFTFLTQLFTMLANFFTSFDFNWGGDDSDEGDEEV